MVSKDSKILSSIAILTFLLISTATATLVDDVIKRVNDVVCIFLCIIWYIVAGLAALILLFAAVKYISAESPGERDESKKRIFNAIVGLIIVLIAMPFVNYLIENTRIVPFQGCDCSFAPTNATTTTLPGWTTTTRLTTTRMTTTRITTTLPGWTTTSAVITTTTHGTTTTTTLIECFEACIDEGYIYGECKIPCDDDEVPSEKININCPLGTSCCCKIATTITTTSTTKTTTIATTTTTKTTTTTTSTTTTVACAIGSCTTKIDKICIVAAKAGLCYSHDDPTGHSKGLDEQCGPGMRQCCCDNYLTPSNVGYEEYNKCCGPPP